METVLQVGCGLRRDAPVLVGVSGGPDSLCLLDLLVQLGYMVVVVHVDHGLRAEAVDEAERVRRVAQAYGVPFRLERFDVRKIAELERLSIEEAARQVRYRSLFGQARLEGAQAVAVGHTADDQVETVLMHLLRGAGVEGLSGMSLSSFNDGWAAGLPLVRPLLGVWRAEVEAYCAQRGLEPVQDASNLQRDFYRNRLRHDLLPLLMNYNPQVRQVLWRMARVLEGDAELLQQVTEAAWRQWLVEETIGRVVLRSGVGEAGRPLLRRLLRRAISRLRPALRDVDFETVERAIEFICSSSRSRRIELAGGLQLTLEMGQFVLLDAGMNDLGNWPQVEVECVLPVPGELVLANGWRMIAELGAVDEWLPTPFEAWLDEDELCLPLTVRRRRPGDRFQPLGMETGTQKVSDFMVNVRIPRRARAGWPLVCCDGVVAWVPGYRPGHGFRLRGATRSAVHLKVLPPEPNQAESGTCSASRRNLS